MDPVLEKEIQNLIDDKKGDTQRLEFILESIKNEKKVYNSDQKYLINLLTDHSKDDDILERLDHYLNPKSIKTKSIDQKKPTRILHTHQKWCAICERGVLPERDFSAGALLILLLLGIIPGLIYYAIKNKTCPICKHDQWIAPPSEK